MDLNKKFFQWLTLIFLSLLWGASFILIKKGLIALSPIQLAAFRMSFAYLFFLPFALFRLKKISKQNWKNLVAVGFIGNFFPAFLFAYAEQKIPSAIAGMLNSTTTLFTWLLGLMFFRVRTSFVQILGIFIGFLGAVGLMAKNPSEILTGWNLYAVFILIAAAFYGFNTNIVKFKLHNLDGLSVSALSFFFIGPFALATLFSTDLSTAWHNPKFFLSISAVFILAFFSSFVAIIVFNILIKYTTAVFAASVTYLIPFFAMFWGLVDGEKISIFQIISMFIVILGVYLANKTSTS